MDKRRRRVEAACALIEAAHAGEVADLAPEAHDADPPKKAQPLSPDDARLAWSLDALELLAFVALMAGRTVTIGDASRAAELTTRARELGLTVAEDPRPLEGR